jgi:hypothetical protein
MGQGLQRAKAAAAATRRQPRTKRITEAKAARLVDAMEAIRECSDFTEDLRQAFDDARAAISPFYDR